MSVQYITARNILLGCELENNENIILKIENGKIIEIIKQNSEVTNKLKDKLIDFGDTTIVPGFIDCHNHLALDARIENHLVKMNDCEAEQTIRAIKTMKDDLMSGVTTARCMGDRYYLDIVCKNAQKEGRIIGPKLVVSGIGMRASHGHGYVGMPFDGAEEFRKQARENVVKGADLLKVFSTKVINATPFIPHFMNIEELKAVVEVAKSVGLTTACHCSGGKALDKCLEAGIDCLEHVYYISDDQIEKVKELDRWVVYTPSYAMNDELLYKFSPKGKEESQKEKEIIMGCLSNAIKKKLKFGIGTDGLHGGLAKEAEYISKLGADNIDVIKGITVNAAKLSCVFDKTGSLEVGKCADMVVLDGNPLSDITALGKVKKVIQDGIIVK